ncbi:MAG: hypothetical protein GYA56_07575 [Geobacteraceae bacterium]|nr:hypothetical protein [Geobacteraceae bacterium]
MVSPASNKMPMGEISDAISSPHSFLLIISSQTFAKEPNRILEGTVIKVSDGDTYPDTGGEQERAPESTGLNWV